jgi:hypothetical protein
MPLTDTQPGSESLYYEKVPALGREDRKASSMDRDCCDLLSAARE